MTRQRRLTRRFVIGLVASVIGGAIAVGARLSPDLGLGVFMVIACGVCFVWASNRAVVDFPDLTPLGRSTITFTGGAAFTGLIFLIGVQTGWVDIPTQITTSQIGLLSIYSIAAMALSQILFIASVGRLGIALTSFHINVAPFYVMMILIVLGGTLDWRAILGAVIVGVGVVLSQDRA